MGTCRGDIPHGGAHPYITQDGEDGEEGATVYISNLKDGAMCGFKYFKGECNGRIEVTVRGSADGSLIVTDGTRNVAEIALSPSEEWMAFSAPVAANGDKFALYFKYAGGGCFDFLSFELNG